MFSDEALGPFAIARQRVETTAERAPQAPPPPPEVLLALHEAAQLLDELAARDVDLHFDVDRERDDLVVELRRDHGPAVSRSIPLAELARFAHPCG
ncbi:MAG: hypothetical protein R3C15_14555 [Thermoleophilia bacterium]